MMNAGRLSTALLTTKSDPRYLFLNNSIMKSTIKLSPIIFRLLLEVVFTINVTLPMVYGTTCCGFSCLNSTLTCNVPNITIVNAPSEAPRFDGVVTNDVQSITDVDTPSEAPKYKNCNVPSMVNVNTPSKPPKSESPILTISKDVRNVPSIMMIVDKPRRVPKHANAPTTNERPSVQSPSAEECCVTGNCHCPYQGVAAKGTLLFMDTIRTVPSIKIVQAPSKAPKYKRRNVPSMVNVDAPSEAPKPKSPLPTISEDTRNVPSIMRNVYVLSKSPKYDSAPTNNE